MKVGLIAKMDNSGLGNQTWEAYRHLSPDKTIVIDTFDNRGGRYPDRYNIDDVMIVGGAPSFEETNEFLKDLDIVFACETATSSQVLRRAKELGVRTIIQANYEYAPWIRRPNMPRPDVFGLPTKWHFEDFPDPKIVLPVPIAIERFEQIEYSRAVQFLHIVGRPAAHDRNGTEDLIAALEHVKSNIVLTIYSMKNPHGSDSYVESMIAGKKIPSNIRVVVVRDMPENYWDLYKGYQVLVMPRRYGGLCLPANEALGAGMPVIMPAVSPNYDLLPADWLTEPILSFEYNPSRVGNKMSVYRTDPKDLADKIDKFATDTDFYRKASEDARTLAQRESWDSLKSLYLNTFDTIVKAYGQDNLHSRH